MFALSLDIENQKLSGEWVAIGSCPTRFSTVTAPIVLPSSPSSPPRVYPFLLGGTDGITVFDNALCFCIDLNLGGQSIMELVQEYSVKELKQNETGTITRCKNCKGPFGWRNITPQDSSWIPFFAGSVCPLFDCATPSPVQKYLLFGGLNIDQDITGTVILSAKSLS